MDDVVVVVTGRDYIGAPFQNPSIVLHLLLRRPPKHLGIKSRVIEEGN
jgi:hypothetical protein